MHHEKFDPAKLERLNDPARLVDLDPRVMWEALGEPDVREIVDLGAGTGLFAARFAQLAPAATVYAIDIEPVMVAWMREHRAEVASGRVVPLLAEETVVPRPDGSADLVATINLHHELADPGATYREALRLLRPGGKVLAVDWTPGAEGGGPPQEIRVPAETLAIALQDAGFGEVTIHRPLRRHSLVTGRKGRGA